MYRECEENLFGVDMRHKPPITILPAQEHGWGCSHGRLAYSSINRAQEKNYSEYAVDTMGFMPKNFIIVNANEVKINRVTAIKVGHGRMAIPVKEFARQRKLSLKEQWELMNPQWIGTYFNQGGIDYFKKRRPSLEQAISDAMADDSYDEFMSQFWSAEHDHKKALERLERRATELERRATNARGRLSLLRGRIEQVQSDITNGRFEKYNMNVHEYLNDLQDKYRNLNWECIEDSRKSRQIKEYINSITY